MMRWTLRSTMTSVAACLLAVSLLGSQPALGADTLTGEPLGRGACVACAENPDRPICFENIGCGGVTACLADSDCPAGEGCVRNNCCGGAIGIGACAPLCTAEPFCDNPGHCGAYGPAIPCTCGPLCQIATQLGAAENPGLAPVGVCGTVTGGNENSGYQLTPFSGGYDFTLPSPMGAAAGDTPDFHWIHEITGSRLPKYGTWWTFGSTCSTEYILHPSIDHGPVPEEGLETTLYGSDDAGATWVLGTLVELYAKGWNAASIEDDPSSRWVFPKPVSMISAVQGLKQGTYEFIDGDTEIDAICLPDPVCGDCNVDSGEDCDDGNSDDCDACDTNCKNVACGNGIVQCGEECDDGDSNDNNDCTNACNDPVCGDRITWNQGSGTEQCDDGDNRTTDFCLGDCKFNLDVVIPAVSEWGLIVMGLVAMVLGTVLFARRRRLAKS